MTERLIKMAASRIREDSLLVLDISDLSKKYARKMEYLATVHDGSENSQAQGYWTLDVIVTEVNQPRIIPLYSRLYSQQAPDHRSENVEIERAMETVSRLVANRGIWVLDRGGDRKELYRYLLDKKQRFIIRLRGDRLLESGDGLASALSVAAGCPALFLEYIAKEEEDQERPLLRAARRVFGIPDFRLYALADGIKHFLFNRAKGPRLSLPPPKPRFVQRLLFDL